MIIGVDEQARDLYTEQIEARIRAFRQLQGYCESLELKVDDRALYENPLEEFKRAFKEVYSVGQLERLSLPKLMELYEVDQDLLYKLKKEFNVCRYEFDLKTFEYDLPDFSIRLHSDEEISRYKSAQKLIDAIYEMKEHQPRIFYANIINGVGSAIVSNGLNLQELQPNLMWVRQQFRG